MDAKSSGGEVGELDVDEDGGDIDGITVKARWGVFRVASTLIATLESKVEK